MYHLVLRKSAYSLADVHFTLQHLKASAMVQKLRTLMQITTADHIDERKSVVGKIMRSVITEMSLITNGVCYKCPIYNFRPILPIRGIVAANVAQIVCC